MKVLEMAWGGTDKIYSINNGYGECDVRPYALKCLAIKDDSPGRLA